MRETFSLFSRNFSIRRPHERAPQEGNLPMPNWDMKSLLSSKLLRMQITAFSNSERPLRPVASVSSNERPSRSTKSE